MDLVVGVSDMKVGKGPGTFLVTYSLGSCIAVAVYDPVVHVGGLLHFMLPDAGLNPAKAQKNPFTFADTGIPYLFKSTYRLGAKKQRMKVIVVGGARSHDEKEIFNIGKRNAMAARKVLWKNNVMIDYQDLGGSNNRTLKMSTENGRVWLKVKGKGWAEIACY